MNFEKDCSAVVYRTKYDRPEFLVAYKDEGRYAFPAVRVIRKENKEEPDRVEIRREFILEVNLDTVFRDDLRCPSEGNAVRYVYAAEAKENGGVLEDRDPADTRLEWKYYDSLTGHMADDSDEELLKHAVAYLSVKKGMENPVEEFGYIWYREHGVDIHSHIVPGADDGSQSEEETMELLRLDREEGIQWVFATPHYGIENGYAPDPGRVHSWYREKKQFQFLSGSPVKALLGTEWYCSEDIVSRIRNREAFPMGDSDWYMVEFLEWGNTTEPADVILRRLQKMKDNGIHTILAHPERYRAIQEDRNLAKRICDLDVRLQVNAYDLFLNKNDATRNLAQWMAKEEMISFIGSDMHGTRIKADGKPARRPQMKEGIRWLYENVDDEYANKIVRINAERYLGVEKLL